jgi:alpha-beta hydrolase superfamily lysophospholipase
MLPLFGGGASSNPSLAAVLLALVGAVGIGAALAMSTSSKKNSADIKVDLHMWDGGPDDEERNFGQQFTASTGNKLAYRTWAPKNGDPKGVLFILHGLHEHGGRYAPIAHFFTRRGLRVECHDHIGHGLTVALNGGNAKGSDHEMGYVRSEKEIVTDAADFIRARLSAETSSAPAYIYSHSMGTLICAGALSELQSEPAVAQRIKAVIFSGCALQPGPGSASPLGLRCLFFVNKSKRLVKRLASAFAALDPHGPNAPIDKAALTHRQSVLDAIPRDPLHFEGKIKNRTGYSAILLTERVRKVRTTSHERAYFTQDRYTHLTLCTTGSPVHHRPLFLCSRQRGQSNIRFGDYRSRG